MTTIAPGQLIPDGLARRLAGHYANASTGATGALACLFWTGQVLPGTDYLVLEREMDAEIDSRGNRDPQAVAAERRALAHYCRVNKGRHSVPDWLVFDADDGYDDVVPWAWREQT